MKMKVMTFCGNYKKRQISDKNWQEPNPASMKAKNDGPMKYKW